MKRILAWSLTLMVTASIALAGISSMALTYVNPTPLVIKQHEKLEDERRIRVSGDYGTISSAKSSDPGIAMVGRANKDGIELTGIKPGSCTLTIQSYSEDQDGSLTWHTVTMTINVVTDEALTASMGQDADVVLTYGQKYTDTSEGYYQIIRYASTNSSVATGSRSVSGDLEYPQIVAGQRKGECVVSFFYRVAGQSGEQERKIKVTVVAPGDAAAKPLTLSNPTPTPVSSTTPSSSNTQNAVSTTVPVGQVSAMTDSFYKIDNIKSKNSSIATAATTGSEGEMSISITGVAAGSTTIDFDAYTSASSSPTTYTVSVTVTAASDSSTPAQRSTGTLDAASETTGVYLSVRSFKTTVKKSFYAAVRIDGLKVNRTKDTELWASLRWVSSDPKVFTVDSQTGKITTVAKGTAKLICVDKDGKSCDAMTITVS